MRESEPSDEAQGAPVRHRRSLPLYVGAGGIATASHYAVTIAAVELLSIEPIAASAGGFTVGAIIKYWLNYCIAFRSQAPHGAAVPRFLLALGGLMVLNTLLFAVFERGIGMHYLLAQALTTVLLIPPGYVLNRNWVFG